MATAETYHMRQSRGNVTFMWKVNFKEKTALYIEKFLSLALPTGILQRLQHLIIQLPVYYLLVFVYMRLKIRKFQTFSSKSGRGRLREVVAYKRFPMYWFGCREEVVAYERWSQPEIRLYLHQACEGVNFYLWTLNFSVQDHASSKSWHISNLRVMAVRDIKLWTCFLAFLEVNALKCLFKSLPDQFG